MGESASGRFTYQSSGCVIWTCMHHMRGGMVLGERMSDRSSTIVRRRRRRDHDSLFFKGAIWEW